ncbi:MAG: aspartate/glutamate racemase family protein, partial [Kiloniellales bacterium]
LPVKALNENAFPAMKNTKALPKIATRAAARIDAGAVFPRLGILALDTRFPRLPGDLGNPASWPFAVAIHRVPNATVARVVRRDGPERTLLAPFVAGIEALQREGVAAVTTTCGFLVTFQEELARASQVPFLASSLSLVPEIAASLPAGQRVGVVTIDAGALSPAHLAAAKAPADTPVEGIAAEGELARVILGDRKRLDRAQAEAEAVAAALRLIARAPSVGAIVLECANLPPYRSAIEESTGLPVHDLLTHFGVLLT